ncbi:hypothetical protein PDJ95_28900 [Bacillus cereus]|nr:hypothetical protein [Bacillus thuringiensis]MDA1775277.1 hypothetical protein [Bacillus cereus]
MGFLLMMVKDISSIADVQGCGVPSLIFRNTVKVRERRYYHHTVQIVGF